MQPIKLSQVAAWCGARFTGNDLVISGISTDSRKLSAGDLFIALRGERFDGHDFLSKAAETCAAAVSSADVSLNIPLLKVEDTGKALLDIAAGYRSMYSPKVIGITGSVGKTTTKEMIFSVISSKYNTLKTQANFNNEIGLPMTVLNISGETEAAVIEMGMNHFGEISRLTKVARPDVAVITNIGLMHIENLGSREGILKAKCEIMDGMPENGTLILNGDDDMLLTLKGKKPFKTVYFGIDSPLCDIKADNIELLPDCSKFSVTYQGKTQNFCIPVAGRHNIYDALAAIACGINFGIETASAANALADFKNTGMRQKIYKANGCTVIEDCYNAGPDSMKAALSVLRSLPGKKKIAVMGSMLELGHISAQSHKQIIELAQSFCSRIFLWGDEFFSASNGENCYASKEQLAAELLRCVSADDVILFKGSHSMHMEEVLKLFLEASK